VIGAQSVTSKLSGLRILLVEDEALVAMLLEGMLDDLGCRVVEWATNISTALAAIETKELDGALLDVNLNGTFVYPVAEALTLRNLPFVFVSGYGQNSGLKYRFPEARVLQKPFESSQLARIVIDEIVGRR
jgi:CheY-like chemotaxis protein